MMRWSLFFGGIKKKQTFISLNKGLLM
ncbi:hypothetical protein M2132_002460, partial [Dysgonomonas sp. PH5-45]|nr:hypothetical protein [Dysgonomonas sp. PH5-45]MDH6356097.1 hypothetical protein [Dysgonomonas sp. PH5-45]MDH6388881.1 hypothetical protein [Dysgonomonas sp. PH5-37]MDH6388993.1 hypothetical protein [Dysgonomonas sp. PH5-37]